MFIYEYAESDCVWDAHQDTLENIIMVQSRSSSQDLEIYIKMNLRHGYRGSSESIPIAPVIESNVNTIRPFELSSTDPDGRIAKCKERLLQIQALLVLLVLLFMVCILRNDYILTIHIPCLHHSLLHERCDLHLHP